MFSWITHTHRAAFLELAEQDFVRQGLLDVLLDHPGQRPGAKGIVIALLAQPAGGFLGQVEGDVAVGQWASSSSTNFSTTLSMVSR